MGKPRVQFIKPPNTLMKLNPRGADMTPNRAAIRQAEAAVEDFGKNFHERAIADIEILEENLRLARGNDSEQEVYFSNIFSRAMDLKGQGGSFGFDLITEIGDSLKNFTGMRDKANPRDVEIITAHVDAMKVVLTNNIRGGGGEIGGAIVAGLRQLTDSY